MADAGEAGTDAAGRSCTTDADCGTSGQICGFEESLACAAQGQCFPPPEAICNAIEQGCACDGTEINVLSECVGLPSGYALKPLKHTGACEGGTGL